MGRFNLKEGASHCSRGIRLVWYDNVSHMLSHVVAVVDYEIFLKRLCIVDISTRSAVWSNHSQFNDLFLGRSSILCS